MPGVRYMFYWSTRLLQNNSPVFVWRSIVSEPTATVRLFSGGKKELSSEGQKEIFKSVPKRRLTRYQMDYLRSLRADFPDLWPLRKLAKHFRISYPAVVKILKSKFQPSEEVAERQDMRTISLRNEARSVLKNMRIKEEKKEELIPRIKSISAKIWTKHGLQTVHRSSSQAINRQQSQSEVRPQFLHSTRSLTGHRAQSQHRSRSQTGHGAQGQTERSQRKSAKSEPQGQCIRRPHNS